MHFFIGVLPLLKRYICLFQLKEPLIHKLFEEQRQLYKGFLSLFVKTEFIQNKPIIELLGLKFKDNIILPTSQMYMGNNLFTSSKKSIDAHMEKLYDKEALIACLNYLRKTLSLRSSLLKCLSAIDPSSRGHSLTLTRLKRLPRLIANDIKEDETVLYDLEVHKYQIDDSQCPSK